MLLKTNSPVFNINIDKSNDNQDDSDISHINEYYNLKQRYLNFLISAVKLKTPSFLYNIGNISSNYPLEFIQSTGKYTIRIIDDITRKPVYEKHYIMNDFINLRFRAKQLMENIVSHHNLFHQSVKIYEKFGEVERSREELNELKSHKLITKTQFDQQNDYIDESKTQNMEDYQNFRNVNNKLLIELDIVKKLILDEIKNKNDLYNELYFNDIMMDIYQHNNFNIIRENTNKDNSSNLLKEYYIMNLIQNQKYTNKIGSLIINTDDNQYYILDEEVSDIDIPKIDTYIEEHEFDKKEKKRLKTAAGGGKPKKSAETIVNDGTNIIKVKDMDNVSSNIPYNSIKFIKGLYHQRQNINYYKNNYAPIDKINSEMAKFGYKPVADINKESIIINNIGGKDKYYKSNILYLKTYIKEEIGIPEPTQKNTDVDTIIPPELDYADLYNNKANTRFVINMRSSVYPGELEGEIITKPVKKSLKYNDLLNTPNWRLILSTTYIDRDVKTGAIVPIVIDGLLFASIEHYYYFSKYYNQPGLDGEKLTQYNEYASLFTLNNDSIDSMGEDDANSLKNKINTSYIVRSGWDDKTTVSGLLFSDTIIIKAMYIQFNQNKNMSLALMNTKDALLVKKVENPVGALIYSIAYHQMIVRNIIKKGLIPEGYINKDRDLNQFYIIVNSLYRNIKDETIEDDEIIGDLEEIAKPLAKSLDNPIYEELIYYNISVDDDDGVSHTITCIINLDTVQPLGYYDDATRKIRDFTLDTKEENAIFDKVADIIEEIALDDERLTKLTYLKDIQTNKLYIDIKGQKEEIGTLKLNKENQTYIQFI
jgi:hypothetical protein